MNVTTASAAPEILTTAAGQAVMLVQSAPPHWVTYIAALLTPVVAGLGILIAYRQWKTAQQKLNLDLFNRRFSVYDATIHAVSTVARRGSITTEEVEAFVVATRGAKFLFNADVEKYLEQMTGRLENVANVTRLIDASYDRGEDPSKLIAARSQVRKMIGTEWEEKGVDAAFKDFMKLPA